MLLYGLLLVLLLQVALKVASLTTPPFQNITHCGNITCSHVSKCKDDGLGGQECVCFAGYQGHTCHDDLDECKEGLPCGRRGSCINNIGSYSCQCMKGWVGLLHCEDPDNSTDHFECVPGWTGFRCNNDINECLNTSSNTCNSNQICINTKGSYRCECKSGWSGDSCSADVNECTSSPCGNGGSCTNTPGGYNCTCKAGWQGIDCLDDVDECIVNICEHSGNCTNTIGSFHCACLTGWIGNTCNIDVNECQVNSCKNLGTCNNMPGSYTCTCAPGWEGTNCVDDVDECKSVTCNHSGVCKNTVGSFFCACTSNWTGVYCSQAYIPISIGGSSSSNTAVIVGAVVGSLILLGGLVTGILIAKYKWKSPSVASDEAVVQIEHNTNTSDTFEQTAVSDDKVTYPANETGKVKDFVTRTRVSLGKFFVRK